MSEREQHEGPELPYFELLERAGAEGRVLHRVDIYGSGPPVDLVSQDILEFVLGATGQTILDVGCGIGPYVKHLNDHGRDCVGVDTNVEAVADGRAMGRPLEVGTAYGLPYEDDAFDSVVLIETLEHLDDYESALREAFRVARSSVALTVPDIGVLPLMSKRAVVPWHMLEATHINFFTPEIMRKTLMRHAASCEVTTLAPFFEVDGQPVHMHVAAVGYLAGGDAGKATARSRWARFKRR